MIFNKNVRGKSHHHHCAPFCQRRQNGLLFLPHFPASDNHQQRAHSYAANFLKVAPELPPLCLALLAKFFGVFGFVAAALFAFVPELNIPEQSTP